MWGWLTALIRGVIEPFIASWRAKQVGRLEQQRDDLQATQALQERIHEAIVADSARRRPVTLDRLRDEFARTHPPAADPSPQAGPEPKP